ncbi:MAG: hypothetical protein H7Z37_06870, partial [Pyrinomonadaceae bacterium]|nr:hypothetical protein [Pyrinomonadaceae bacterium]
MAFAQNDYENALISSVEVVFENSSQEPVAVEQFLAIVRPVIGNRYSQVKNRDALQALFDSKRVVSARVEVSETGVPTANSPRALRLRFFVKRTTVVERVFVTIGEQ